MRDRLGRPSILQLLALLCLIVTGAALRAGLVLSSSFPLGDGGMFFVTVKQLLAHAWSLPRTISYNGNRIPFAYPPLGFYLTALLHTGLGVSLTNCFCFEPLAFSILSLGAFALLARVLLPSAVAALGALAAFSLLPDAFHWELKGGGITRSPAQFFALLALSQIVLMYRTSRRRYVVSSIVSSALVLVTHPEWSFFLAYSVPLLAVFQARGASARPDGRGPVGPDPLDPARSSSGWRAVIAKSAVLGVGALVLSAPWWLVVLLRFGPSPLMAAILGSAQAFPIAMGLLPFFSLSPITEPWFPVFTALGLLGLADCIGRRQWLLPTWMATILIVNYRGPVDRAVILVALLTGVGLQALITVLRHSLRGSTRPRMMSWEVVGMAVAVLTLLARGAVASWSLATAAPLALSSAERAAMLWAEKRTPASSRFSVVTSASWALDANSEWFPALSGRTSVATVQGTEWIPHLFAARFKDFQGLQACAAETSGCLIAWSRRTGIHPNYVYLAHDPPEVGVADPTAVLASSLAQDPRFHVVFRNRAVTIYRWRQTEPAGGES